MVSRLATAALTQQLFPSRDGKTADGPTPDRYEPLPVFDAGAPTARRKKQLARVRAWVEENR